MRCIMHNGINRSSLVVTSDDTEWEGLDSAPYWRDENYDLYEIVEELPTHRPDQRLFRLRRIE